MTRSLLLNFHYTKSIWQILIHYQEINLSLVSNLLLTLQNLEFSLHCHILNKNLKFINKFNFQLFDLTDTEYITLYILLLKYKPCYATHKHDVGMIATPFRIRLKPNAQLLTTRSSKVPIHYRDKLNKNLKN